MKIPNGAASLIVGGLLLVLGLWAFFGDTSLRQSRRMSLARQHLSSITNAVHSHPEFRDVRVMVGTAAGGCFVVGGLVDTEEHLTELHRIIAAQQPPVRVVFQLKVFERNPNATP